MGAFTDGVTAGARAVSSGYENERKAKQQQLTAAMANFEYDNSTGTYQPNKLRQKQDEVSLDKLDMMEQQLKATNDALKAQQSYIHSNAISNTLLSIVKGNWQDAYHNFYKTPGLKDAIASAPSLDAVNISPINYDDPNDIKQLQEMKVDTSKLQDPSVRDALNGSLMKVQGHDGSWRLIPVDQVMKATNTWNMFNKEQQDQYTEYARKRNAIIQGLNPKSEDIKDKILGDTAKAMDTGDLSQVSVDYYAQHPEALAKASSAKEELAKIKLEDAKEEKAFKNIVNSNPVKVFDFIRNANSLNDKLDGVVPAYTLAKKIQGDAKLGAARRDYLDGMYSTVSNTLRLKQKLSKKDFDWDATSKAMAEVSKITGPEWLGMSEKEKGALLDRFSFDSDLRTIMAGYIKAMSGAAVSDQERAFYENAILGGNWGTREAALASMNGFISGVANGYKESLNSMVETYPADYLNYSTKLKALNIDSNIVNPKVKSSTPVKSKESLGAKVKTLSDKVKVKLDSIFGGN